MKKKISNKQKKEDAQAIWFFIIISLIFISFLIPYFYNESRKRFEYSNISWKIEEYPSGEVYHGRFKSFIIPNNTHNIFLRIDPRKNDVEVEGNLTEYRFGTYVSFSRKFDMCRGDVARAMVDFGQFILGGIGLPRFEIASSEKSYAEELNRPLVNCSVKGRTIFMFNVTGRSRITVSKENPTCYLIELKNCTDIAPIEKFITRAVSDFRAKYGWPKFKQQ